MTERSLWPVGFVAALATAVAVSGVALWAWGQGWMYLLSAAAFVVMLVFTVRRDVLADPEPQRRLYMATAATVMAAGVALAALGLAIAYVDGGILMPIAGVFFATTGYVALRRQRMRQEALA